MQNRAIVTHASCVLHRFSETLASGDHSTPRRAAAGARRRRRRARRPPPPSLAAALRSRLRVRLRFARPVFCGQSGRSGGMGGRNQPGPGHQATTQCGCRRRGRTAGAAGGAFRSRRSRTAAGRSPDRGSRHRAAGRACSGDRCSRCSRPSRPSSWPSAWPTSTERRPWPSSGSTPRITTGRKCGRALCWTTR